MGAKQLKYSDDAWRSLSRGISKVMKKKMMG